MEEECNGEIAFLNNGIIERSLYWYIRRLHIVTNTYITAVTTKKLLFSPCLIEHILLSQINMTYTKETLE